jgi:hypothetical protein
VCFVSWYGRRGGEREGPKTNGKKRGKNSSLPSIKPVHKKKMVHGNIKTTSFPPPPPSSCIHLITKMTSF